jgi:outer membrane protein OmpA-like peptidoglycan-associated protein/tetratricopeptide (TPR) repeat protein
MHTFLNKSTLLCILFFTLTTSHAQKRYIQKAEVATKAGNYQQALYWMQQGIAQGYVLNERESLTMGELYYSLGQYTPAVKAYEGFFSRDKKDTPSTLWHYAHALKVTGASQAADQVLLQGRAWYPNDSRFMQDPVIASQERSYFDHVHQLKDTLQGLIQLIQEPNGDLYGTDVSGAYDQLWTKPKGGSPSLVFEEAKYNQGGVTFSSDGTTAYVAMNAHQKNKLKLINNSYSPLQIYKYSRQGGSWSTGERLSISSDLYSTSSPALGPDGALYFVSDQPGGVGQTDIYKAALSADGRFGKAELLDKKINTEGRESHVFVDQNNVLYFSSDGHPGLGGLDVFAIDLNDPSAEVYHLGTPINTPFDDFGYTSSGLSGYVSSNRSLTLASYVFEMDEPLVLQSNFTLEIGITNHAVALGEPVIARLMDQQGAIVWTQEVTHKEISVGQLKSAELPMGTYVLNLQGAHIQEMNVSVEASKQEPNLSVSVELNGKYNSQEDILSQWGYPMLTFDFDQHKTDVDSAVFEILARRLSDAKSIVIEGHSDQKGKEKYNQKLSEKRAEFIRDQLLKFGLVASKLQIVGKGERELMVNCRFEQCTKQEEQKNRRVMIKAQF